MRCVPLGVNAETPLRLASVIQNCSPALPWKLSVVFAPIVPYVPPPNHLTTIREGRYKLAKYYDVEVVIEGETPVAKRPEDPVPPQWEMYDLKRDPHEERNLAAPGYKRSPLEEREFKRLRKKLEAVEKTRLRPLAS